MQKVQETNREKYVVLKSSIVRHFMKLSIYFIFHTLTHIHNDVMCKCCVFLVLNILYNCIINWLWRWLIRKSRPHQMTVRLLSECVCAVSTVNAYISPMPFEYVCCILCVRKIKNLIRIALKMLKTIIQYSISIFKWSRMKKW